MMRAGSFLLATAVIQCLLCSNALAQKKPTVGDVLKRAVDVRVGEKVPADPERARQNYEAFLGLSNVDASLSADAMRRLGDLKLEAGEEERIGRELAAGAPLATQDAIRLYSRLLENVPGYPRADAVLYQLARAYEVAGDTEGSLRSLETLVSRFPGSALAAEAQFRRGEIFFSARRWLDAETAYQALLIRAPKSEFVEQATYKLGWARFKSGDTDGALDAFTRLLDRQLIGQDGQELDLDSFARPRRELVEDTLRVSAVIFSADEGASGVEKFLARVGRKPYSDLLYATLGDLYAAKERWTDAATAYSAFAKREPLNERAPLLQSVAIDVYRRGGFSQLMLTAKQDYVEHYGLHANFWSSRRPEQMPLVVREVKQNLQDLAAYYHELAQSSKAQNDYQEAARWYREFLEQFPKDVGATESAYLLSDALFESHRYAEAANEYLKVAYDFPASVRSAAAAYAAVVAFEKEESGTTGAQKVALHRQLLDASLRFGKAFPEHPESGPVLVRAARQFLLDSAYEQALDVAGIVQTRRADLAVTLVRDAWIVTATSEFALAHYDRAENAGTEILNLMASGDPQRASVEERLAASIYRQAEALRDAHQSVEAAHAFLRIGQRVPRAAIRETAEYDAAAAFLAAEQWKEAIEVLERFRHDYAQSPRQGEVTRRLAVAYLAAQQPQTAAREFERIAQESSVDSATQREALAQAAELYEKAGDSGRATIAIETYLRRFPEPFSMALEFRKKLADFALAAHDSSRRTTLLVELVRVEAAAGAERTDRSRYVAAGASLELAAAQRDQFVGVRLSLPLKRSLEAKRAALQKALQAYERADEYAIAEISTAATFEMAELYRRLGTDLMNSERPKALSGDAVEQYGLLLEEQAFPFEEKSIGLHELNASRAASGVYDAAVRRSFEALADLKPARYGKKELAEELAIDLMSGAQGSASLAANVRFQEAVAVAPGDAARSEQEMKALASDVPSAAGPLLNLGILAARGGRYLEAESLLAHAEHLSPQNASVLAEHGRVLRYLGRFVEAERAYRDALALEPDTVSVRRNLGILLDLYLGRPNDAVGEWRRAIELEGGDKMLEGWVAEVTHRNPPSATVGAGVSK